MKIEYIICGVVFILVIVVVIITLTKNKLGFFTNKENSKHEGFVEPTSPTKTLKYFGGGYCPYSNTNSNAYKVINEFASSHNDVKVEYYWTEDNQSDMEKYKIMYVPTILGKNDQPIELRLPDDYDKTDRTDSQLKEALMNHLYEIL